MKSNVFALCPKFQPKPHGRHNVGAAQTVDGASSVATAHLYRALLVLRALNMDGFNYCAVVYCHILNMWWSTYYIYELPHVVTTPVRNRSML